MRKPTWKTYALVVFWVATLSLLQIYYPISIIWTAILNGFLGFCMYHTFKDI